MSNISDLKNQNQSKLISNIRLLKIIAMILGILIIIGIMFLFLGLAKSYNNLGNEQKKINKPEIKNKIFNEFIFSQPRDAQLISTSLGNNNEILLRYLYQGNNVLVVLNANTQKLQSIITLKRGKSFGKENN